MCPCVHLETVSALMFVAAFLYYSNSFKYIKDLLLPLKKVLEE